jgi:hypothetical protein
MWDEIVAAASHESPQWTDAALSLERRQPVAVFSPLAPERYALGLETIYEAYLVHYGRPRLFDPPDEGERILLGDYLYAHGLVRIADAGGVDAVAAMAELISRCAALRAAGDGGDGDAWVDATRALGGEPGADEVDEALDRHSARAAHGAAPAKRTGGRGLGEPGGSPG